VLSTIKKQKKWQTIYYLILRLTKQRKQYL
jgi:hypothetical protein